LGVADRGHDLARRELEEPAIPVVKRPVGADAGDQDPVHLRLIRGSQRKYDRRARRLRPATARKRLEPGTQVVEDLEPALFDDSPQLPRGGFQVVERDLGRVRGSLDAVEPARAHQTKPLCVGIQEIDQGKGNVPGVLGQGGRGDRAGLLRGLGLRSARPELPERPELPLAHDLFGRLRHGREHATDPGRRHGLVRNGAVRDDEMRLFEKALRSIRTNRSSLAVAGPPEYGTWAMGPMMCQISAQHSLPICPSARGCLAPGIGTYASL
jgi:hypothetical protein